MLLTLSKAACPASGDCGSGTRREFLIDGNLSQLLAEALKAAGHDVVHVRDLGMQAAGSRTAIDVELPG
jgi:hypothetical protein